MYKNTPIKVKNITVPKKKKKVKNIISKIT